MKHRPLKQVTHRHERRVAHQSLADYHRTLHAYEGAVPIDDLRLDENEAWESVLRELNIGRPTHPLFD